MIVTLISTCSLLFAIATTSVKTNEKVEILIDFVGNEFRAEREDLNFLNSFTNGIVLTPITDSF